MRFWSATSHFYIGFAQDTTAEKDAFNLNPWKPKFEFENTQVSLG